MEALQTQETLRNQDIPEALAALAAVMQQLLRIQTESLGHLPAVERQTPHHRAVALAERPYTQKLQTHLFSRQSQQVVAAAREGLAALAVPVVQGEREEQEEMEALPEQVERQGQAVQQLSAERVGAHKVRDSIQVEALRRVFA